MKHPDIVKEIDEIASEIKNEIKNDRYRKMKRKCNELCNKYSELSKLDGYLGFPPNTSLPFFAYGIFKPGQVSFSRILPFVKDTEKDEIKYSLFERDGIPIVFEEDNEHKTNGYIITFKQDKSEDAYDIIREIESKTFYKWAKNPIFTKNGKEVNILFGKKHENSNPIHISDNYDGINDVFFDKAIALIANDMKKYDVNNDEFENFFQLQKNYMLLWTAIERYNSLKYGENPKMVNNKKLAKEKIFQDALRLFVKNDDNEDTQRIVFSSEDLKGYSLNPNDSISSIIYYYTMRSNVVHRGKSVIPTDEENLRKSLLELLMIFQFVLKNTFKEYQIKTINYKFSGIGVNNKLSFINI